MISVNLTLLKNRWVDKATGRRWVAAKLPNNNTLEKVINRERCNCRRITGDFPHSIPILLENSL